QVKAWPRSVSSTRDAGNADCAHRGQCMYHDGDCADERADQELNQHHAFSNSLLFAAASGSGGTTSGSSSRTHAVSNSQATARMIGPMNRPTMPCANVPPITPRKMT